MLLSSQFVNEDLWFQPFLSPQDKMEDLDLMEGIEIAENLEMSNDEDFLNFLDIIADSEDKENVNVPNGWDANISLKALDLQNQQEEAEFYTDENANVEWKDMLDKRKKDLDNFLKKLETKENASLIQYKETKKTPCIKNGGGTKAECSKEAEIVCDNDGDVTSNKVFDYPFKGTKNEEQLTPCLSTVLYDYEKDVYGIYKQYPWCCVGLCKDKPDSECKLSKKNKIFVDENNNDSCDQGKDSVSDSFSDEENETSDQMLLYNTEPDPCIWEDKFLDSLFYKTDELTPFEQTMCRFINPNLLLDYSQWETTAPLEEEKSTIPHNDHDYTKPFPEPDVLIKQEVDEKPPARKVGRPRRQQPKYSGSAAEKSDDSDEELIDTESFDDELLQSLEVPKFPQLNTSRIARESVKNKRTHNIKSRKGKKLNSYNITGEDLKRTLNSSGYVNRKAKDTALVKLAKVKSEAKFGRCNKRNDHNFLEKRRRFELKVLFDKLKDSVPLEYLRDENDKLKNNPSKNTILNGATKFIQQSNHILKKRNKLTERNIQLKQQLRKLTNSRK